MNGTLPTYPSGNVIVGNHFDTVGVNMKQTSCYFKAITFNNTVSNNICHDGPRAGVNYNDGFMGGDLLEENVIWAMVRETGDHGKCRLQPPPPPPCTSAPLSLRGGACHAGPALLVCRRAR